MRNFIKSILNFILSVVKDMVVWFFRGVGVFLSSIIGFFLVILALLTVIGIFSQAGESTTPIGFNSSNESVYKDYGGEEKIALIDLNGEIVENESQDLLGGGVSGITPDGVYNLLKTVKADEKVKGLVLNISSPGGSPVASDRIFQEIVDFKNETKIPVVVLMGDIVASGGYYISAPADYILANPSTITGSIGVILQTYNLSGLYEKIGVKKETFKSGKYKDILNDSREITAEEREMINELMKDTYENFLIRVSQGRRMEIEEVRRLAEGKIYSGVSAVKAGLVDEVGTLDDAILKSAKLAGLQKFKVVKFKSTSILEEVLGQIKFAARNTGINLGIVGINQPKYKILYKLP